MNNTLTILESLILRLMDVAEIIGSLFVVGSQRSGETIRDIYQRTRDIVIPIIRGYAIFLGVIIIWLGLSIGVLVVGLLLKSPFIVTGQCVLSSVLCLVIYLAFRSPVQFLAFIAKLLGARYTSCELNSSVTSALYPLLSAAFFIAGLGAFVGMRGLNGITILEIGIYTGVVLMLIILSFLTKGKTLRAHYLMLVLVILNLFVYLFPIQGKAFTGLFRRSSTTVATGINQIEKDGDLVLLRKGITVYDEDGVLVDVIKEDVEAKVIDTKTDDETGEDLHEVIVPKEKNNFYKGMIAFVPVRLTEKIIREEKNIPKDKIESHSEVSSYPLNNYVNKVEHRGQNEVFVKFNENDTVYTDIIINPGDIYSFINPTAPFRVDGWQNSSYVIKENIDFECKSKNMIKVYGCGFKGEVTIKLFRIK